MKTYTQNLHTHSVFDHGRDTCESTVLRAIELGLDSIGFSGHSYMPCTPSMTMSVERTAEYKKEVARLKELYADKIEVFCGVEFDIYSPDDLKGYDYVIGAFHNFYIDGEYVAFDRDADALQRVIDTYFGGSGLRFAKEYYEAMMRMPEYGKCDIVAHFDLVAKHNETCHYVDVCSKEYTGYVLDAIDVLTKEVGVFEINTGGIPRGYRKTPYPDMIVLKHIRERGGNVVISSDCHDNRFLNSGFSVALELARECGFREVLKWTKGGFVSCPI